MERETLDKPRSRPSGLLILGGLGLGALAMYLSDPQMGRTRRARIRSRYESAAR